MTEIPTLTAILLLAWLTEALTEYVARPWLKPSPGILRRGQNGGASQGGGSEAAGDDPPLPPLDPTDKPVVLRYAAMLLGVVLAVAYHADLLALAGLVSPWSPYVGYVVTGLVIGRGSNFMHDLADRWLAPNGLGRIV